MNKIIYVQYVTYKYCIRHVIFFINNKVEEKKFFLRRKQIYRTQLSTFYYYFSRRDEFEIYRMIQLPVISAFF